MAKKKIMKIVVVDTYYNNFLKDFYRTHRTIKKQSYNSIKKALIEECFGTSDYYSFYLNKIGIESTDLIVNDAHLQSKWAKENNLDVKVGGLWQKIQLLPYLYRFFGRPKWIQKISVEQIKSIKPDVVYIQDLSILNPRTLKKIKKYCKLLVGQIACPLPNIENLKQFDLILTSFPHYVKKFREMGIKSEYFKIGFDPRVLKKIGDHNRKNQVSFVGSFSPNHTDGTKLLEYVSKNVNSLKIWGHGIRYLPLFSPIRRHYQGKAWGKEMYEILARSKIVINRHISAAQDNANNMRLYESTGMGAMLITDKKKNLNELFTVGKEVVEYSSPKDLVKKIKYYLKNDNEREKIALAGQKRTLKYHNYELRMKELVLILKKYLK